MRYTGLLDRALNPISARQPLSGEAARKHGGRFNAKGMPARYTSQSVMTAICEANQIGALQPTTLVAHDADIGPVLDATVAKELVLRGLTEADLATDDWRMRMLVDGKAQTPKLAEKLKADGFSEMQVRSSAKGATAAELNLVLWVWRSALPTRLRLIDGEVWLG